MVAGGWIVDSRFILFLGAIIFAPGSFEALSRLVVPKRWVRTEAQFQSLTSFYLNVIPLVGWALLAYLFATRQWPSAIVILCCLAVFFAIGLFLRRKQLAKP
jgi:hypothetical protein